MNKPCALAGLALAALAPSVNAAIVGTSGAMQQIATPPDARLEVITSADFIRCWNERQNVAITDSVIVDAVAPGLYDAPGDLVIVELTRGTMVSSHYLHFDSPGSQSASAAGTVIFDQDIIGVIVVGDGGTAATRHLDRSDYLGAPTLYPDALNARGMELSPNGDRFRIHPDRRTLDVAFGIAFPGDYVRVLTRVPTPGSLALGGLGLGMAFLRRRR